MNLRHNAFEELEQVPGLPEWPPDAPDLFPGVDLPEVNASEVSAETLRSGILRHGALLVRGLVDPPRVARLIGDIDAAMDAVAAWRQDRSIDTAPWFVPFVTPKARGELGKERPWVVDGGGVWTVDSPRALFDVLDTFAELGLDSALTKYLGERPALSVKKWTLRRVPVVETDGVFQPNWHQDGAFLGEGIRTINFWLTLTHCGDTAPGLDVVPRRMDEILPTGTDGALFDWSVGEGLVAQVAEQTPVARPIFEAGDAVVLRRTFPAPHRRRSDDDARALRDRVVVLRAVALPGRSAPRCVLAAGRSLSRRIRIDTDTKVGNRLNHVREKAPRREGSVRPIEERLHVGTQEGLARGSELAGLDAGRNRRVGIAEHRDDPDGRHELVVARLPSN